MVKLTTGKRLERDTVKLVVGEQLPKRGTCKHYRKSYRWLRFPCCGRAYPCDVCHNDVETHECEFANRMICGFCSKEQVSSSFRQIMFHFIHFWPISSNLLCIPPFLFISRCFSYLFLERYKCCRFSVIRKTSPVLGVATSWLALLVLTGKEEGVVETRRK